MSDQRSDYADDGEQVKLRRRYAVHLNRDTWEILSTLSQATQVSMSSLVHALLIERTQEELAAAVKSQRSRRRGRPRKSFHI